MRDWLSATVATGGTAAIVCGAALTGSILGGSIGAVTGGVMNGTDGMYTGFLVGTISGGILGAVLSGGNIALGGIKVIGTAQKTGTVFHQAASNIEAGIMAMQPGRYSKITFELHPPKNSGPHQHGLEARHMESKNRWNYRSFDSVDINWKEILMKLL